MKKLYETIHKIKKVEITWKYWNKIIYLEFMNNKINL